MVGAQGGPARDSSSQRPGHTSRGDVESCPGGGRCSRRACGGGGGGQLQTARAHLLEGTEGPAQAAASFRGVPSRGGSLPWRVPVGRGGSEALPGRWPLLRHALTGPPHPLRLRASPSVELWAGSSGPKTVLTPRPRELEDGVTLRPYPAMLSSKQAR